METVEQKDDMIKVSLGGESVWAALLSENKAEIRNNPLDERVNYKDIVEVEKTDGRYSFVKVLERTQEQAGIQYDFKRSTVDADFKKMAEYLRDNEIGIEGMFSGQAIINFKHGRNKEEIQEILNNSPLKIIQVDWE